MEFENFCEPNHTVFGMGNKKELTVIFLTDYHMKERWIPELEKWVEAKNDLKIDLVLLGGDFDNLSVYSLDHDHPEYKISEARITDFFCKLGFLSAPIYFVPGNHDPVSYFQSPKEGKTQLTVTDDSFNSHLKIYEIGENLWIAGIGGCCPAVKLDKSTKTTSNIWVGFPYASDSDSKYDIEMLEGLIKQKIDQDPSTSILLLTHNGPSDSGTVRFSK